MIEGVQMLSEFVCCSFHALLGMVIEKSLIHFLEYDASNVLRHLRVVI